MACLPTANNFIKEEDICVNSEETNMCYCKSRYYVPEWCRWLNGDSVGYLKLQDINGLKKYRFFDKYGNRSYDKDFKHSGSKIKFPHYHGWVSGVKLGGHWTSLDLIKFFLWKGII